VDEQAFLRAVCENPADDAPRLVYADSLDERGDPRGEFIRLGCELARLRPGPDEHRKASVMLARHSKGAPIPLRGRTPAVLLVREQLLLDAHWRTWAAPVAAAFGRTQPLADFGRDGLSYVRWRWRRGFVAEIDLPLAVWVGGECERCGGLRRVRVTDLEELERIRRRGGHPMVPPGRYVRCDSCGGSGRIPGCGRAVVRAAPIELVTVTGKRPLAVAGDFGWVLRRDGMYDEPLFLPREVWDGLRWYFPAPSARVYARCYPTEAAANAALSDALLAMAREG
jgi:uncharacterized protein (TIGR02996 family)